MDLRVTSTIKHLLWRTGFGPSFADIAALDSRSKEDWWLKIKNASSVQPEPLVFTSNFVTDLIKDLKSPDAIEEFKKDNKTLIREKTFEMRKVTKEVLRNLNLAWMDKMIFSDAQLREKMSLFWHGHFACRHMNGYHQQELLQIIRSNALENFGDLLRSVSKSPAMLSFLNNLQNRKRSPNENFAREVMELFTLGRGHYTEEDVKNAARAFTGWSFDNFSGFIVVTRNHDDGIKTFLGKTGNFNGDDIIDILLQQKRTARYIVEKIYRFFVSPQLDNRIADDLTEVFYKSNYNIMSLMEKIFTSDWFYNEKNIGCLIKSPVELIAGIRRFVDVTPNNPESILFFQKVLGQVLFMPQNVAGWPGGKSWIDSTTLMARLQLPRVWASKDMLKMVLKADDDVEMGKPSAEVKQQRNAANIFKRTGAATWKWESVYNNYTGVAREKLYKTIGEDLLSSKAIPTQATVENFIEKDNRENYISTLVIQLMSTPEYQLC